MFIVTGLVLWALSEAGLYGEGILRDKRIGEKCGWSEERPCSPGLTCDYGLCKETEKNITWVIENCDKPPPVIPCPPQSVNKIVSYFDYREYPNKYIIPSPGEVPMEKIPEVDYGACKEICSRNSTCQAVCYYANTRECHLRSSKGINPPVDAGGFWTCGVRVAF
jgi:hypothetical protein